MSGTIHVLEDNPAQPRLLFYSAGVLTDLDASAVPTVTITRPDGTAGPASGTVTRVNVGIYTFTLAAASTTDPTIYTVVGTGNIGGQLVTDKIRVEVVGDLLFNLADLRAVKIAGTLAFQSTTDYPDATLLARRAEVTDDFEQRCGWSFIPRFARQVLDGDGRCELILDHLKCSKLLSVTVNGVVQPVGNYTLDRSGVLRATSNYMPSGWFQWGIGNVAVEYVHGWDRPPQVVSSAGLARTAMLLQPSQFNGAVTITTPDGASYNYSQAGQSFAGGGRRFYGQPDIDAVLSDPAYNAMGMAIA